VLGLLVAEQPPPGRALNPDELNTIRLLAGQAGIAVENARLYETTERLSRTDGLTLLYNHRFFQERIREEFKRSDRFRQTLALLMIDVDDFKRINDTFGHQAGDRVLRRIARVLRESLRAVDVAARYGGDEFAIILPDTDLREASEVAERLRRSVEKHPFFVGGTSVTLTLSLGAAARLPQSPVLSEELIKMADHALFQAKTGGRNTVATYPLE
jgi:diguanylate cyclase (GGDEF)-like protein